MIASSQIIAFAQSKQASLLLFIWAVAEACCFFILPDFLLVPLCLFAPKLWSRRALWCVIGSLCGSVIIGILTLNQPQTALFLIENVGLVDKLKIVNSFNLIQDHGLAAFLWQPFSLIPLKAFIFNGLLQDLQPMSVALFIVLGRSLRNFLVAYLAQLIGERFKFNVRSQALFILIVWGIAAGGLLYFTQFV